MICILSEQKNEENVNDDEVLAGSKDIAVDIELSTLMKLNVKDLKEELRIRQQDVSGNEVMLRDRLKNTSLIPVISALIRGAKNVINCTKSGTKT